MTLHPNHQAYMQARETRKRIKRSSHARATDFKNLEGPNSERAPSDSWIESDSVYTHREVNSCSSERPRVRPIGCALEDATGGERPAYPIHFGRQSPSPEVVGRVVSRDMRPVRRVCISGLRGMIACHRRDGTFPEMERSKVGTAILESRFSNINFVPSLLNSY
jgi:hypothetical protein